MVKKNLQAERIKVQSIKEPYEVKVSRTVLKKRYLRNIDFTKIRK